MSEPFARSAETVNGTKPTTNVVLADALRRLRGGQNSTMLFCSYPSGLGFGVACWNADM